MEELEKMSLVELRLYGRKLGMKNATTFKKQELIGEIQKILAAQNTPARERTEGVSGDKKEEASAKTGKRTVSRRTAKQKSGEDNSKEAVGPEAETPGVPAAGERTSRRLRYDERPARKMERRTVRKPVDYEERSNTMSRTPTTRCCI